ncbi:hypothetical protein [Streptomyces sp. NPDC058092]|uniref:hypothetical protein n=1 Tax=Streptomyces sp. NPDC058092 TaxID=3346336 RepID=UPI0036F04F72
MAAPPADGTVSPLGDPQQAVDRLGQSAGDADVVIDYLWDPAAERAMNALPAAWAAVRAWSPPNGLGRRSLSALAAIAWGKLGLP